MSVFWFSPFFLSFFSFLIYASRRGSFLFLGVLLEPHRFPSCVVLAFQKSRKFSVKFLVFEEARAHREIKWIISLIKRGASWNCFISVALTTGARVCGEKKKNLFTRRACSACLRTAGLSYVTLAGAAENPLVCESRAWMLLRRLCNNILTRPHTWCALTNKSVVKVHAADSSTCQTQFVWKIGKKKKII